jgi:hypothetical protein
LEIEFTKKLIAFFILDQDDDDDDGSNDGEDQSLDSKSLKKAKSTTAD